MLAHDVDETWFFSPNKTGTNAVEQNTSVSGVPRRDRTADIKVSEDIAFSGLSLSQPVLKGLHAAGYKRPSPVQLKAIPFARCGIDTIVQAKSGTGKTVVFSVVALEAVSVVNQTTQVIIIVPTREIADQVKSCVQTLGVFTPGLSTECFIGGLEIKKDYERCKSCHIAVGTPGRICQLIQEGYLNVESVRLYVLDEADQLMQESFKPNIDWLFGKMPSNKQIIACSATYPAVLQDELAKYMRKPVTVQLDAKDVQLQGNGAPLTSCVQYGIKQYFLMVEVYHQSTNTGTGADVSNPLVMRVEALGSLLSRISFGQCLVFCSQQQRAEAICSHMLARGWQAKSISSKLAQKERLQIISELKRFKFRLLISTDLTARGIDLEHVNLVINFDVPFDAETYFHRIGRAGRFGGYGCAVSLLVRNDNDQKFFHVALANRFHCKELAGEIPHDLVTNAQFWECLPEVNFRSLLNEPEARISASANANKNKTAKPILSSQKFMPTDKVQKATSSTFDFDAMLRSDLEFDETDAQGFGCSNSKSANKPCDTNTKCNYRYSRQELFALKPGMNGVVDQNVVNAKRLQKSGAPAPVVDIKQQQPVSSCLEINGKEDFKEPTKMTPNAIAYAYSRDELFRIRRNVAPKHTTDNKSVCRDALFPGGTNSPIKEAESSQARKNFQYSSDELYAMKPLAGATSVRQPAGESAVSKRGSNDNKVSNPSSINGHASKPSAGKDKPNERVFSKSGKVATIPESSMVPVRDWPIYFPSSSNGRPGSSASSTSRENSCSRPHYVSLVDEFKCGSDDYQALFDMLRQTNTLHQRNKSIPKEQHPRVVVNDMKGEARSTTDNAEEKQNNQKRPPQGEVKGIVAQGDVKTISLPKPNGPLLQNYEALNTTVTKLAYSRDRMFDIQEIMGCRPRRTIKIPHSLRTKPHLARRESSVVFFNGASAPMPSVDEGKDKQLEPDVCVLKEVLWESANSREVVAPVLPFVCGWAKKDQKECKHSSLEKGDGIKSSGDISLPPDGLSHNGHSSVNARMRIVEENAAGVAQYLAQSKDLFATDVALRMSCTNPAHFQALKRCLASSGYREVQTQTFACSKGFVSVSTTTADLSDCSKEGARASQLDNCTQTQSAARTEQDGVAYGFDNPAKHTTGGTKGFAVKSLISKSEQTHQHDELRLFSAPGAFTSEVDSKKTVSKPLKECEENVSEAASMPTSEDLLRWRRAMASWESAYGKFVTTGAGRDWSVAQTMNNYIATMRGMYRKAT